MTTTPKYYKHILQNIRDRVMYHVDHYSHPDNLCWNDPKKEPLDSLAKVVEQELVSTHGMKEFEILLYPAHGGGKLGHLYRLKYISDNHYNRKWVFPKDLEEPWKFVKQVVTSDDNIILFIKFKDCKKIFYTVA